MDPRKVYYIWDEKLLEQCDRLPAVSGRASLVHNLVVAYGLLPNIKVLRSLPASYSDMREFHSELYLDHLKNIVSIDDDYMPDNEDEEYGIGYDCPPVSNMFDLVSTIAGGSITAAKCLTFGIADVVINWCGGWHHANRFGAEGFCYVNDIVLAIEKLRKHFSTVLYIDLDVHHGNGVQDAYSLSKSVFTLSFHKYEPGFYPGTGSIDDIGTLAGKGYACNVPLHAMYNNSTLVYVFENVFTSVYSHFKPNVMVMQCGADALARDPHGGASVTTEGYCKCVKMVLDKRIPTLLLGGGGYRHDNAARLWTSITALATGTTLEDFIPEHSHWLTYGPSYTLSIEPTLARDLNKMSYLKDCVAKIRANLRMYLGEGDVTNQEKYELKSTILQGEAEHRKMLNEEVTNEEMVSTAEKKCSMETKIEIKMKTENNDVYNFSEE